MALDPRIALAGQQLDVGAALRQAQEINRAKSEDPIRLAILRQQQQAGQQQAQQTTQAQQAQGLAGVNRFAQELLQIPDLATRNAMLQQNAPMLQAAGVDVARLTPDMLTDDQLNQFINSTNQFVQQGTDANEWVRGATDTIKREDGTTAYATSLTNKRTGETKTVYSDINGKLLSGIGETAEEQETRRMREELNKAGIRIDEALSKKEIEAEYASLIKQREAEGRGAGERGQEVINRGRIASEQVPNIKRSIQLLESVETGGFDAVANRVAQVFGVQGADEGELSYNLGKTVIKQYREVFGAQFTAEEGKKLDRIEAQFSKNPEVNRRLLKNLLKTTEDLAKNAERRAATSGDYDTAKEIQQYLNTEIDPEEYTFGSESQELTSPGGITYTVK